MIVTNATLFIDNVILIDNIINIYKISVIVNVCVYTTRDKHVLDCRGKKFDIIVTTRKIYDQIARKHESEQLMKDPHRTYLLLYPW